MRRGHAFLAIVVTLLAVASILRALDPLPVARMRSLVFDTYQQFSPRALDPALPVRIVAIDEESLARIGQWPWPRSAMAELMRRLSALGATAVGFDIVFPEPDRLSAEELVRAFPAAFSDPKLRASMAALPTNDGSLAAALAAGPSVLGFIALPVGNPAAIPEKASFATAGDDPRIFLRPFASAAQSLPQLVRGARGLGALNWLPEPDQVVRRMPLLVRIGDTLQPAFSLEVLRIATGSSTLLVRASGASGIEAFGEATGIAQVRVGAHTVPTDGQGQIWMRFAPSDERRYIPAWKVLAGEVGADDVRGRIVLIGARAAGLLDLRTTPLDASIPGVEIHAQVIEQVLAGVQLNRPDFMLGAEIFYLLVVGGLVAALIYFSGAASGALLGALALIAVTVLSWLAYSQIGWLVDPVYPSLAITLLYIAGTAYLYKRTETERRQVRSAFSRYMAPAMVEELAAHPERLKLGGESREMTILFADVRGFTTLSEGLDAQALTRFVNRLFTPLSTVILEERGTIDKYMGDAVMAFWNAPLDDPDHAANACRTALRMLIALESINRLWSEEARRDGRDYKSVQLGIGLNTGLCCVGNLGSEQRFDYSVIGDDVNVASRLEGLTKDYGVPIIVGERTAAAAGKFAFLEIGGVAVRGKQTATRIHALVGDETMAQQPAFKALAERHRALVAAIERGDRAAADVLGQCRGLASPAVAGLYDGYARRLGHERELT